MKRIGWPFLLIALLTSGFRAGGQRAPVEGVDLEIRGMSVAGRSTLCVGGRNSIRVELAVRGRAPSGAIPIKLVMIVPGGDAIGIAVAEGSVQFTPASAITSFTFLNVEIPERMRGRGGLLEVRVNLEQAIRERELANNVRAIRIDSATDWSCRV